MTASLPPAVPSHTGTPRPVATTQSGEVAYVPESDTAAGRAVHQAAASSLSPVLR